MAEKKYDQFGNYDPLGLVPMIGQFLDGGDENGQGYCVPVVLVAIVLILILSHC